MKLVYIYVLFILIFLTMCKSLWFNGVLYSWSCDVIGGLITSVHSLMLR